MEVGFGTIDVGKKENALGGEGVGRKENTPGGMNSMSHGGL